MFSNVIACFNYSYHLTSALILNIVLCSSVARPPTPLVDWSQIYTSHIYIEMGFKTNLLLSGKWILQKMSSNYSYLLVEVAVRAVQALDIGITWCMFPIITHHQKRYDLFVGIYYIAYGNNQLILCGTWRVPPGVFVWFFDCYEMVVCQLGQNT